MSFTKNFFEILIIDDSLEDTLLIVNEIKKNKPEIKWQRVDNKTDLQNIINSQSFDIIISDYSMPQFDAFSALEIIKSKDPILPFIIISGAIGEELAIKLMKSGASDYLNKNSIKRINQVIERELNDANIKKEQMKMENLLKVQREWDLAINKTLDINETLKLCFDAALNISGMDCGGIYLVNEESKKLELTYYSGISTEYLEKNKSYDFNSERMNLIKSKNPVYFCCDELINYKDSLDEGLKAVALISIKQEDNVIASIFLGSHKIEVIPDDTKLNIDHIINHIGATIIKTRLAKLIKESEEKYRELVDGIGEGFFSVNKEGIITFANKSLAKILGSNNENEIIGKNFIDFIKNEKKEKYLKKFREMISSGNLSLNLEMSAIRINPSTDVILDVRSLLIIEDSRLKGVRGLVSDKTEKILAQKEIEILNKELVEKNKELEQIIYIASHDLRTPLVNVIGFSNELEQAIEKIKSLIEQSEIKDIIKLKLTKLLSNEVNESIYFIKNSTIKIETLLKGLLRVERLNRNRLELHDIDMNQLIKEILTNFDYSLKTKNFQTEINDLPHCKADLLQISQVFSNIIDNAIKYYDPEKKNVIKISGTKKKADILYCFEDNGIGIPANYFERIFEIFHRVNPGKTNGEGLGLTIVKKIIELHNGKVWVESSEGNWTKFYISLPLI